MRSIALASFILLGLSSATAQFAPRPEDHFWRRRVVNRIDLTEKINVPLVRQEAPFYASDNENEFAETQGVVKALFNGLKAGKYLAYHPDSITKQLTWDDVFKKIRQNEADLLGPGGDDFDSDEASSGDGGGFDDFSGEEDWGFGDESGSSGGDFDDASAEGAADSAAVAGPDLQGDFDIAPYEAVIQFIEDRIFDKTRSEMIYEIRFIQIVWTDPGGTLPEKVLCTFRYQDVLDILDQTQWKNRFNDATYKTMREIFELRLFHSYMINVSGDGLRTLRESEDRRQKLVEFEHHLWSY